MSSFLLAESRWQVTSNVGPPAARRGHQVNLIYVSSCLSYSTKYLRMQYHIMFISTKLQAFLVSSVDTLELLSEKYGIIENCCCVSKVSQGSVQGYILSTNCNLS